MLCDSCHNIADTTYRTVRGLLCSRCCHLHNIDMNARERFSRANDAISGNAMQFCVFCRSWSGNTAWTFQGHTCIRCWKRLGLDGWHGSFERNKRCEAPSRRRPITVIPTKPVKPKIVKVDIEEITDGPLL